MFPTALADQGDPSDVVYIAIGSRHYAETSSPDTRALPSIRGANRSARTVANLLSARGAEAGVLLTSTSDGPVTRDDVFAALDAGIAEALVKADPFLFVYFAGHGLSEGFAWTHLSIPGDVAMGLDSYGELELDLDAAVDRAIPASTLVDHLDQSGLPYLLILDTCYEGDPVNLEAYQRVLSGENRRFLADMADILRFMNQFRQSSPVVFSTEPGTLVTTVPDPDNELLSLAPLARRLALLRRASGSVTLNELINHLTSGTSDTKTRPGITFAETRELGERVLMSVSRNEEMALLELTGSGTESRICCRTGDPISGVERTVTYRGALSTTGPEDEWVTQGRSHSLSVDDIMLDPDDLSALSVVLWPDTDEVWTVSLSTGDGSPFKTGETYVDNGLGGAELSISGNGRGCSEDIGQFEVADARFDGTGLVRLEVSFRQSCDGDPAVADGRFVLERF
ncbi:MAG: hypothetical protein AAGJ29_09305 [Pseudomonadota bacterium]